MEYGIFSFDGSHEKLREALAKPNVQNLMRRADVQVLEIMPDEGRKEYMRRIVQAWKCGECSMVMCQIPTREVDKVEKLVEGIKPQDIAAHGELTGPYYHLLMKDETCIEFGRKK